MLRCRAILVTVHSKSPFEIMGVVERITFVAISTRSEFAEKEMLTTQTVPHAVLWLPNLAVGLCLHTLCGSTYTGVRPTYLIYVFNIPYRVRFLRNIRLSTADSGSNRRRPSCSLCMDASVASSLFLGQLYKNN